ncbi:uncharacterized protein LOC116301186 isoform X2 [Actinia tenebrosa]|uniref:Uncharacterized protein LOC116301186 isoform X2 n=1 Tax=Actinia tenebrosa TaxID=6105 RepID=A0A6P8IH72_ACTTE|nr:uncharacterized protein LOC116301186 isoform X2 [Actinia tenebrosa]
MDTNEEWSVPNSDDERDEELLGLTQNGCHDVPVKILKYYEDIEKNKVLELNVKEFRKPFKQDIVDGDKDSCQKELQEERKDDEESSTCADEEKETHLEKSNEPSEFDYLEEPDECQGQLTRRTPKTGNHGWHTNESTCLKLMRPGFESRRA